MKFRNRSHVLREEAGGEAAGGLGGAPEAPPVEIIDGDAPPPAEFAGPEWAKGMKLDAEILNDPSLKAIGDVEALTKSYVHGQRHIGEKGAIIPNENSTKEEWDTFYQKTGVPLEEQGYIDSLKFPSPDAEGSQFNQAFNQDFAKAAHEARVRPDQATKLYEFFNEQAKTTADRFMHDNQEKNQTGLNELKSEWGEDAYNVRLNKAEKMLKENAGDEFLGYLNTSGLGKDPNVVKALGMIADKFYKEEEIPNSPTKRGMTVGEVQQEINTVMGNFEDPYHKPNHPDHKRRVDEINEYFKKLG